MLYIWPFITFFSLPLLYPYGLEILANFLPASVAKKFSLGRSKVKAISFIAYSVIATLGAMIIVHYNTIIHPFTLADNRHYMFYVFRYTILQHPMAKFALTPFYVLGAWLVLHCLGGVFVSQPQNPRLEKGAEAEHLRKLTEGTDTSFVIIWFFSTALSLITAPLVEPRYFIIPWLLWRLQVPPMTSTSLLAPPIAIIPPPQFPLTTSHGTQNGFSTSFGSTDTSIIGDELESHDHRLYLETLWFICINAATGYIFLYRGFEWSQEPGNIQRFMW